MIGRQHLSSLPRNVRFIVTSRYVPHIQRDLDAALLPRVLRPEQLRRSSDTVHSLVVRLMQSGFADQFAVKAASALLERSGGSMVYPVIALEILASKAACTMKDISSLPEQLTDLYDVYFNILADQTPTDAQETVIELLQVFVFIHYNTLM